MDKKFSEGDPIIFKDHRDKEYIGIFLKKFTSKEMIQNVEIEVESFSGTEFNMYKMDNSTLSTVAHFALDFIIQNDMERAPTYCQILIGNKKIITIPVEIQKLS